MSPWDLIDAIGGGIPVMPADPEKIAKIFEKLKPDTPQEKPLLPTGKGKGKPLPRPKVSEGDQESRGTVTPPLKPGYVPPLPPRTYPPREEPVRPPIYQPPTQSKPPVYYPPQHRLQGHKASRRPHRDPSRRPHGYPPQHEPEGYPPQHRPDKYPLQYEPDGYQPEFKPKRPHRKPQRKTPNWKNPWGGGRGRKRPDKTHETRPQDQKENRRNEIPITAPGGFF